MSPPPSYSWALRDDESATSYADLSLQARLGRDYAIRLADDANARRRQNLRRGERFPPLTTADIADDEGQTQEFIEAAIAQAHHELFNRLQVSDYNKALARRAARAGRAARVCKQPKCRAELDAQTHGNREYCDEHRNPAAHVRRHRTLLV